MGSHYSARAPEGQPLRQGSYVAARASVRGAAPSPWIAGDGAVLEGMDGGRRRGFGVDQEGAARTGRGAERTAAQAVARALAVAGFFFSSDRMRIP